MSTSSEWQRLTNDIICAGDYVEPRPGEAYGGECIELIGGRSMIAMNAPVLAVLGRKLSYRFMAAEAAWILDGDNRLETIKPFNSKIANFSDDGQVLHGAYGPKVMPQLDHVVETLARDRDSRQAVVNIWRESPPQSRDIPCTLNIQWLIRDGRLICIDTMRSSDVWLGWPYDVFAFSMISAVLAARLRVHGIKLELGELILNAGSQHLYVRDVPAAMRCTRAVEAEYDPFELELYDEKELRSYLWAYARGETTDGFMGQFANVR